MYYDGKLKQTSYDVRNKDFATTKNKVILSMESWEFK
jgi:hypothetical protein